MKILKYLDFFGIHFHFYIGNKRKLYTSYGGVISIICVFCCLCIFFILTFKELLHKNPISNLSSVSQAGYHKIKFGKEKLWIPWRIIDHTKNNVNYNKTIYPKLYIIKGEKKNIKERFTFQTQPINFKLCNETDFAQRGKHHYIDASLNELYCMDFDNIELGGGWTTDFLNYLQFDIYICKDGINYNKNNENCSNFEKMKEKDTWGIEYFYPIVEYQPTNYENPILVIYKNQFYNFSKYLSKEERMYVQEYVLNDDKGLIFNDDLNSSFWGYISSDFDITYFDPNESTKIYSLSIFLDAGKILYVRRYNKIYTIIANVFPIFNAVFFIFETLSYMVKTIMTEKYLSELFFQRINENDKIDVNHDKRKSTNFFNRKYKINLSMSRGESNKNVIPNKRQSKENEIYDKNDNKKNKIMNCDFSDKSENSNYENKNNKITNNDNNNEKTSNLSNNNNENKKKNTKTNKNFNISSSSRKTNKSNLDKFNNKLKDLISNKNLSKVNNSSNNNSSFYPFNSPKLNNFVELNLKNANINIDNNIDDKNKDMNNKGHLYHNDMTNIELHHKIGTKLEYIDKDNENEKSSNHNSDFNFYKNKGFNNSAIITRFRLKGSLFKMRDYIYSFFIKAVRKEYRFLSKDFAAIFNFLSEIYDVSSYLQLYKQFHIISGFLLDNIANININHKININNHDLFEQVRLKNKNVFYFALKRQIKQNSNNNK